MTISEIHAQELLNQIGWRLAHALDGAEAPNDNQEMDRNVLLRLVTDVERRLTVTTLDDVRGRATITVPEAGQLLGLSRDAAYRAANAGEIPTLTLGRRKVVPVATLLAMVGRQAAQAAGDEPRRRAALAFDQGEMVRRVIEQFGGPEGFLGYLVAAADSNESPIENLLRTRRRTAMDLQKIDGVIRCLGHDPETGESVTQAAERISPWSILGIKPDATGGASTSEFMDEERDPGA